MASSFSKKLLLFFFVSLAGILSSCASHFRPAEFYREVAPTGIVLHTDSVYWVPIENLNYDLVDTCATLKNMVQQSDYEKSIMGEGGTAPDRGGCLATGSSNARFDFNNALRKVLLKKYPQIQEMYPGEGGVPEGDLRFDPLVDSLGQALSELMNDFEVVEARQFCYENRLTSKMRFFAGRLYAEYPNQFVWIPFKLKVKVWANEGGSGRVQWSYGLAFWDLQTPRLIYVAHQKEDYETSSGQNVDKDIFELAEKKIAQDLQYLTENLELECAKEMR